MALITLINAFCLKLESVCDLTGHSINLIRAISHGWTWTCQCDLLIVACAFYHVQHVQLYFYFSFKAASYSTLPTHVHQLERSLFWSIVGSSLKGSSSPYKQYFVPVLCLFMITLRNRTNAITFLYRMIFTRLSAFGLVWRRVDMRAW